MRRGRANGKGSSGWRGGKRSEWGEECRRGGRRRLKRRGERREIKGKEESMYKWRRGTRWKREDEIERGQTGAERTTERGQVRGYQP